MQFCDSHFHADDYIEAGTIQEILLRAEESNVTPLIAIGGSIESNQKAIELSAQQPGKVFATAGFDRDLAGKPVDIETLRTQIQSPGVCAVGESGLDYYYEKENREDQLNLFKAMLDLAAEFSKPIVVHTREADQDTYDCLNEYVENRKNKENPGVIHCFTGTLPFAQKMIELGFYISFSGILTFKNAEDLRNVARHLPLDRILIETDAPYLAPIPHRGQPNEPAWVKHVAEKLAEIRSESLEEIAKTTHENTVQLFGLPSK